MLVKPGSFYFMAQLWAFKGQRKATASGRAPNLGSIRIWDTRLPQHPVQGPQFCLGPVAEQSLQHSTLTVCPKWGARCAGGGSSPLSLHLDLGRAEPQASGFRHHQQAKGTSVSEAATSPARPARAWKDNEALYLQTPPARPRLPGASGA